MRGKPSESFPRILFLPCPATTPTILPSMITLGRLGLRPARSVLRCGGRPFSSTRAVRSNFDAPFTSISESGFSESQMDVRQAIQAITEQFDNSYWLARDQKSEYPHELYDALQAGQWIGVALPTEYGGAGLGISEAAVMLQTIAESGAGVSGAQSIHANVYPVMPIVEFASERQKQDWLPRIIGGAIRSCFMITEPNVGLETLKIKTKAEKRGDKWVINGSKVCEECKDGRRGGAHATPGSPDLDIVCPGRLARRAAGPDERAHRYIALLGSVPLLCSHQASCSQDAPHKQRGQQAA